MKQLMEMGTFWGSQQWTKGHLSTKKHLDEPHCAYLELILSLL